MVELIYCSPVDKKGAQMNEHGVDRSAPAPGKVELHNLAS